MGTAKPDLGAAGEERRRQVFLGDGAEHPLAPAAGDLEPARQAPGEGDHLVVEERYPHLEADRHGSAVHLGQDVVGQIVDGVHLDIGTGIDREDHPLLQGAVVVELVAAPRDFQLQVNEGDAISAFFHDELSHRSRNVALGHSGCDVSIEHTLACPPGDLGRLLDVCDFLKGLDAAKLDEDIRGINELRFRQRIHERKVGADGNSHPLLLAQLSAHAMIFPLCVLQRVDEQGRRKLENVGIGANVRHIGAE